LPRTPLFDSLRRAFRIAALSARRESSAPPIDELLDMACSRRRFLRDSAVATAAVAAGLTAGCGRVTSPGQAPSGGARIAIVGGGMAGLNAAYKLQKAGLRAKIFEGSDRTGGRMFTASNLLGDGITTELGGEFIDSTHEEMLALMDEFGLQKLDTLGPGTESLKKETYFVNGRHYTHAQAARAFVPLAKKIFEDYDGLEDVDYDTEGGGTKFDQMSISQYLDSIGATGWMRELLDVAYVTEYGLDAGEQSSLNFTFLIGTGDIENPEAFDLLGESDERYKVKGGNQQLVDELARRLEQQIQRRHRLESIKSKGEGFTLTFQADSGVVEEDADIVVLAIPFTMLREVNMQVPLSPLKQKAIKELGYGMNGKVLVGFKTRHWQTLGYSGATYTDQPFQLAWDNSFLQPGMAGGLTLYSGGKLANDAGQGTAEEVAARLMTGVERAYPGILKERNGKVSRFHWPTFPWTKSSYSCYRPGQWTTIAGSEGLPEGNLHFAGEHCSYDFQGYMNGAAQSGADTAKAIMGQLSGSKAAQVILRRHLVRFA
jgi:monoamine oxidase